MTLSTPASPSRFGGIHPLVDALAERIRQCRRQLPELAPLEIDADLEAISGSLDGEEGQLLCPHRKEGRRAQRMHPGLAPACTRCLAIPR